MDRTIKHHDENALRIQWYENSAACTCKAQYHKNNIWEYHFRLSLQGEQAGGEYDCPAKLSMFSHYKDPGVAIHICYPGAGAAGLWRPDAGLGKSLSADWLRPQHTNISHSAPVLCYFGYANENVMTVSLSETRYDIEIRGAVNEETGELHADIMIPAPAPVFDFVLRIDERKISFCEALSDVSKWWDQHLEDEMMAAGEAAKTPMYSTWYSYHQGVSENELLDQCRLAADYGMKAVILDDGWQTDDESRGYKYCGDWEMMPDKFPDFAGFVKKLHNMDFKCLVWFSVPYMGSGAFVYERFSDKLLTFDKSVSAGILDPRYPEVRKYLIETYASFLKRYDVDGFKLDFIDSFAEYEDTPEWNKNMDHVRVQDAVYTLMMDVSNALKAEKPDILLEFRQNYIGPSIQRFGNIFRVGDCPMSDVSNRVGIADLKLLSPSLCVHCDMLMWHPQEKCDKVALHLLSSIFSVFQISVDLNLQSDDNKAVIRHYLEFAIKYSKVLQEGEFTALYPLQNYPVLQSFLEGTLILGCYMPGIVSEIRESYGGEELSEIHLLNGSAADRMHVLLPAGSYEAQIYAPTGALEKELFLGRGGYRCLQVPSGGRAMIRRFS